MMEIDGKKKNVFRIKNYMFNKIYIISRARGKKQYNAM